MVEKLNKSNLFTQADSTQSVSDKCAENFFDQVLSTQGISEIGNRLFQITKNGITTVGSLSDVMDIASDKRKGVGWGGH